MFKTQCATLLLAGFTVAFSARGDDLELLTKRFQVFKSEAVVARSKPGSLIVDRELKTRREQLAFLGLLSLGFDFDGKTSIDDLSVIIKGVNIPGITEDHPLPPLDNKELQGKRILNLGEGDSALTDLLVESRIHADAYGVDIKLQLPPGPRHLEGDATRASELAISRNQKWDYILGTDLLCCLGPDASRQSLLDSLEILNEGGTVRHTVNLSDEEKLHPYTAHYFKMLEDIKAAVRFRSYDIEIYVNHVVTIMKNEGAPDDTFFANVVIIKKIAKKK